MVLVKNGKNWVRDLMVGNTTNVVNQAGLGTDATTPAETQTGLNNNTNFGTAGTVKAISKNTADKQIVYSYTLTATEGNGSTYKEFGLSSSTGSFLFNRQTFADLPKTSAEQLDFTLAVSIE